MHSTLKRKAHTSPDKLRSEVQIIVFMDGINSTGEGLCAIYIDMGTTNTRAWLGTGNHVLTRSGKRVGARDAAREGSERIATALRELISELRVTSNDGVDQRKPTCVVGAGMISSRLGLAELPHVSAPAGLNELAASSCWSHFPAVTDLPFLLLTGVRCGPETGGLDEIDRIDVMRGEETLCLGLAAKGIARPFSVVLHLGSHWKAIRLDGQLRIESSVTSLSGELIHASQTQTILRSAVSQESPAEISESWMDAGMKEQRQSGLSRALFCVRLLEIRSEGTAEQRLAFVIGVFIAADLDALIARGILTKRTQVVIAGHRPVAEAWHRVLLRVSIPAVVLTADQAEEALLMGMGCILGRSLSRMSGTQGQ